MPPVSLIRYCGLRRYLVTVWHLICVRAEHVMWRTETISAEITWGFIAIGWAIILAASQPFELGNLYVYLERWGTEEDWTVIMLSLGGSQLMLAGLVRMGRLRLLRSSVWLLSFSVWSYIAWVSLLTIPVSTAAAAHGTLAIGSIWAFVRSREERR